MVELISLPTSSHHDQRDKMASFKLLYRLSITCWMLLGHGCIHSAAEGRNTTALEPKAKQSVHILHHETEVGERYRLRCLLPFSQTTKALWTKDGVVIRPDKHLQVRRRSKRRKRIEVLVIFSVDLEDSGIYVCSIKDNIMAAWNLSVIEAGPAAEDYWEDYYLQGDEPHEPICGQPNTLRNISHCGRSSFPNCTLFPGSPVDVNAKPFIHEGIPVVQIGWKRPAIGYSDLWGYQVKIVSQFNDAGHYECWQINSKILQLTHFTFHALKYGAQYIVSIQSLPANNHALYTNLKRIKVYIDKCAFEQWKYQAVCCSVRNTSAVYKNGQIHVSWATTCINETLQGVEVIWTSIQDPTGCYGSSIVKGWTNYTIQLHEGCQRYNYSVRVYGLTHKNETTFNSERVVVPIPNNIVKIISTVEPAFDTPAVVAIVTGGIAGLLMALCFMFFIYRRYFTTIYIQLSSVTQSSGTDADERLLINETGHRKRVFLVHTRCCMRCEWVVRCLGSMLNCTGLVEAVSDVWNEQKIKKNVMNWYENEIRNANCVVVLASKKMRSRDLSVPIDNETDDPLLIKNQLNLIRADVNRDPETPKFVPAYFAYNGEAKDVPGFLASRMIYALPKDLDRLMYNILNIERIQPFRFRPITILGAKGHPFEDARKDLLKAIEEAVQEHSHVRNNNLEREQYVVETTGM